MSVLGWVKLELFCWPKCFAAFSCIMKMIILSPWVADLRSGSVVDTFTEEHGKMIVSPDFIMGCNYYRTRKLTGHSQSRRDKTSALIFTPWRWYRNQRSFTSPYPQQLKYFASSVPAAGWSGYKANVRFAFNEIFITDVLKTDIKHL